MEAEKQKLARFRRRQLGVLVAQYGTQKALADALDAPPAYIGHLVSGHRNMGEQTARKYERKLGLPPYWLDTAGDNRKNPRQGLHALIDIVPEEDLSEVEAFLRLITRKSRPASDRHARKSSA